MSKKKSPPRPAKNLSVQRVENGYIVRTGASYYDDFLPGGRPPIREWTARGLIDVYEIMRDILEPKSS